MIKINRYYLTDDILSECMFFDVAKCNFCVPKEPLFIVDNLVGFYQLYKDSPAYIKRKIQLYSIISWNLSAQKEIRVGEVTTSSLFGVNSIYKDPEKILIQTITYLFL